MRFWDAARKRGAILASSRRATVLNKPADASSRWLSTALWRRPAPWFGTWAFSSRASTTAKTRSKNRGAQSRPSRSATPSSAAFPKGASSSSRSGSHRSTQSTKRKAQRVFASSFGSTASKAACNRSGSRPARGASTASAGSTNKMLPSFRQPGFGRPSKKASRQNRSESATCSSTSSRKRLRRNRGRTSAARHRSAAGAWCAQRTDPSSSAAPNAGTIASATTSGAASLRFWSVPMADKTMDSCRAYNAARASGASNWASLTVVARDGSEPSKTQPLTPRDPAGSWSAARRRAAPLAHSRLSSLSNNARRDVHAPLFDGW